MDHTVRKGEAEVKEKKKEIKGREREVMGEKEKVHAFHCLNERPGPPE